MTICDLSPFYCEKGGGIRTYHRARIEWFRRQARHRYVLISPGPRYTATRLSSAVLHIEVFGVPVSRDPDRYRVLIDYRAVRAALAQLRPDILEANDPWFSAPYALRLRRQGVVTGLVTAYVHSDPIRTFVGSRVRAVARWTERTLVRRHAGFDAILVASEWMRRRVTAAGIGRVHKIGLGVHPEFLNMRRRMAPRHHPTRLLYVGRLDEDKEFRLILEILPTLLRRSDVRVTVVGGGRYQREVASIAHPRFRYLGFVADRAVMRTIYAGHDVLLAPGRFETFGLAALEAMAAGLLVIGPDEGGTHELLAEVDSPLQFYAGDATAFLDRVQAAIEGGHDFVRERGKRLAAAYGTWDDAIARQMALYESMVEGHGAAAVGRTA